MYNTHAVAAPFGVCVFGSAITRAEPDIASVEFATNCLEKHPKDALTEVKSTSQKVRTFLADSKFTEYGSSRIVLSEERSFVQGEQKFRGYKANVSFNLLLRELDRMEELLTGIVDASANENKAVDFQTSKLKELRAEARQRSIAAAREKAEIYCAAAKIKLGSVIHTNDINPESLRNRESHGMHGQIGIGADDIGQDSAFNPGAIIIGGAVMMAFEIE